MKSVIIYNPDDPLSVDLVNQSIDSCRSFGIIPELFSGIFGKSVQEKMIEHDLKQSKIAEKDFTVGDMGCLLSHFELWNRTVSDNEPYLILEHDITMKRSLPPDVLDHFDELLNLDVCSSLRKDLEKYKKCMSSEGSLKYRQLYHPKQLPKKITWKSAKTYHVVGTHAYIIKPAGANKLIQAARKDGCLPADVHVNCHEVDISVVEPTIFRTCDFMLNEKNRVKFSSTKGYGNGIT